MTHIAVFGSSGAIGSALINLLAKDASVRIHAFSQKKKNINPNNVTHHVTDYTDLSLHAVITQATKEDPFDLVIITNGILHNDTMQPEKSLRELSEESLLTSYRINTVIPALIAKHTIPNMRKESRSVFAVLSARVGSITDNHLGGWYSYRASKAALNMLVKNLSIEVKRFKRYPIIVSLHPGTVDTTLSKPYQKNIPKDKLFTPTQSAIYLLSVIEQLSPTDTGHCFAWDGQIIDT